MRGGQEYTVFFFLIRFSMVNRQGTEAVVSSPLMLNDPVEDYNRDGQEHTIHSR